MNNFIKELQIHFCTQNKCYHIYSAFYILPLLLNVITIIFIVVANSVWFKEAISLANHKEAISLANHKKAISLANYKEAISLANHKEAISLANHKEGISLADHKEAISLANKYLFGEYY